MNSLFKVIKSQAVVPGLSLVLETSQIPDGGRQTADSRAQTPDTRHWTFDQGAQRVLAEAQAQAEHVVAEAYAQAEAVKQSAREAGHREGYTRGYSDGLTAAQTETREVLNQARLIAEGAAAARDALIAGVEAEIVALVLDVARKVIGQEMAQDSTIVLRTVERALTHIKGNGLLRLRVNPADVDLVTQHWSSPRSPEPRSRRWEIVGDATVSRGGCVIDTKAGQVDARIETQLAQIEQTFTQMVSEPHV